MNNAKEIKASYREYRDMVYADFPQVKQFEDKKKRRLTFLTLYLIFISLAKAGTYYSMTGGNSLIFILVGVLIGMAPNMIFLLAAMTPKWKISFVLYFPAVQLLLQIFRALSRGGSREITMFINAYVHGFTEYPFIVGLDILSWLLILLITVTAVWLTAVPKSRELAEQSVELSEKVKKHMISLMQKG